MAVSQNIPIILYDWIPPREIGQLEVSRKWLNREYVIIYYD